MNNGTLADWPNEPRDSGHMQHAVDSRQDDSSLRILHLDQGRFRL